MFILHSFKAKYNQLIAVSDPANDDGDDDDDDDNIDIDNDDDIVPYMYIYRDNLWTVVVVIYTYSNSH